MWPSTTSVDKFFSQFFALSFHVIDLKINGFFYFLNTELLACWSDTLVHHLFLQEGTKLLLILGEMILLNADFHHNLLLKWHSNFLDLSHALSNHSEILIKILISSLFVIFFSVFFEVFGEFEDFLFRGIKWETKDGFDILKRRILKIDLRFNFIYFIVKNEFGFFQFNDFTFNFLLIVITFVETVLKKECTKQVHLPKQHLQLRVTW